MTAPSMQLASAAVVALAILMGALSIRRPAILYDIGLVALAGVIVIAFHMGVTA